MPRRDELEEEIQSQSFEERVRAHSDEQRVRILVDVLSAAHQRNWSNLLRVFHKNCLISNAEFFESQEGV
jgi:hypothetical protein